MSALNDDLERLLRKALPVLLESHVRESNGLSIDSTLVSCQPRLEMMSAQIQGTEPPGSHLPCPCCLTSTYDEDEDGTQTMRLG